MPNDKPNPNGPFIAPPEELKRRQERIFKEVNKSPIMDGLSALRERLAGGGGDKKKKGLL